MSNVEDSGGGGDGDYVLAYRVSLLIASVLMRIKRQALITNKQKHTGIHALN